MDGFRSGLAMAAAHINLMAELRSFLDEELPAAREGYVGATPEWVGDENYAWCHGFNRKLAEAGWLVPHWPARFGGRDASFVEQLLIREYLAYRRVQITNQNGLDMVAPILLRHGTEEQRREHLPAIASGDRRWCQGYSEPEAGSDLTSLRTTAIRHGDVYVVNGSKIWTGHAMRANWMVLLARTNPEARGRAGLSLMMIDLEKTAGITIQPIRSMTGAVTFCQEFFTDVEVPVDNRIGAENGGWAISNDLLTHERSGVGKSAGLRRTLDDLLAYATTRYPGDVPDAIAGRIGGLIERVETARAMAYDLAREQVGGGMRPAMASVMKVYQSELSIEVNALSAEIRGLDMSCGTHEGYWDAWDEYQYSLLHKIGGGTNEIQRDIIATAMLGLPR